MHICGERAVVLGSGMAGLLSAAVLSEFYDDVTIVERDRLPGQPVHRRGVPQGRHLHSLLSRGSQALEQLLPGLLGELAAAGAHVVDDGDLSRVYTRLGPHEVNARQPDRIHIVTTSASHISGQLANAWPFGMRSGQFV